MLLILSPAPDKWPRQSSQLAAGSNLKWGLHTVCGHPNKSLFVPANSPCIAKLGGFRNPSFRLGLDIMAHLPTHQYGTKLSQPLDKSAENLPRRTINNYIKKSSWQITLFLKKKRCTKMLHASLNKQCQKTILKPSLHPFWPVPIVGRSMP